MKPLFTLGQLVATPGALAAIGVSGDDLSTYLARHQSGDWGDIDAHDLKENQLSLEQGFRLMSVYTLSITGVKILVITEADRSSTCILLPEELLTGAASQSGCRRQALPRGAPGKVLMCAETKQALGRDTAEGLFVFTYRTPEVGRGSGDRTKSDVEST